MANHGSQKRDPVVSTSPGWGKRLKYARQLRNLTQAALAAKVGVLSATVSRNECGKNPHQSTAAGYAKHLGVTEVWLLHEIGPGPEGLLPDPDPHRELLEQYYAHPYGVTTPPDIRARLGEIRFADLGIPVPTLLAVHDVRLLLEKWATDPRH